MSVNLILENYVVKLYIFVLFNLYMHKIFLLP